MTQETDRKQMLRCVIFTFFVSGATCQPIGSFIPFLRGAYGFSYDLSGILLSCQSIGNMFAVLAAGFLPYYLGRRKAVLLTAVWMAVAYLIFASGVGTPGVMITAFLMTGIAKGGNSNFSNTMVSTLPGESSAIGYNLIHGGYAIGAMLSPIILVLITGVWSENGWRIMAGLLAAISLAQVAVYSTMPIPETGAKKGVAAIDRSFLKQPRYWLAMAMLFFYLSAENSIVGWQVTYFQDMGLLSDSFSQMMNSLLWLLMFAGRMCGAFLTKKLSREKILLTDGIGMCAFFLLMFFSRSSTPIIIGIIGVGFFMSTVFTTAFSYGSDCAKGNDLGCSFLMLSGSLGGVITPAIVGLVAEKSGIAAGMGVVAAATGMLLLSIVASVLLNRRLKQA